MSREQMIKEARTIEAMKKGYMGLEGKFASIAKYLGQPIIHQGSRVFDQSFLKDVYELDEEPEIFSMDEEENSYEVGTQFDGLSRGVNLTISIQYHLREIVCRYMGRIVYKETSGELDGYAPDANWEDRIEDFFKLANKVEKKNRPLERANLIEENTKKKNEVLEYLKLKWGL